MYKKYFGFTDLPFCNEPDPSFFFMSTTHQRALLFLMQGLRQNKEVMTITGQPGTGKTALFRFLETIETEIDETIKLALVPKPKAGLESLISHVYKEIGIKADLHWPISLESLQESLLLLHQVHQGISIVAVIDEAQDLEPYQWSHLNLLLNMKIDDQNLWHLILIGRPELQDKIDQYLDLTTISHDPAMDTFQIEPLSESEGIQYIEHRLRKAGRNREDIFSSEVLREIYHQSQGIPGIINETCDHALLVGFSRQQTFIDPKIIHVTDPRNKEEEKKEEEVKEKNNRAIMVNQGYRVAGLRNGKMNQYSGAKELKASGAEDLKESSRKPKITQLKETLPPFTKGGLGGFSGEINNKENKGIDHKTEKTGGKKEKELEPVSTGKAFELWPNHVHVGLEKIKEKIKGYIEPFRNVFMPNDVPLIKTPRRKAPLPRKVMEEYQKIKSNLFLANPSLELKSLMFASANKGEGTSTVAINFAITLASIEEAKVLLVDANLRSPKLHSFFNLPKTKGLSEVIQEKAKWAEVVRACKIPHLSIITSGETETNPMPLFESAQIIASIIQEVKECFDYVLFDTCAINTYPDPMLLGSHLNGLVLVVQADKTRKELIHRAKELIDRSVPILGIVLNRRNYYIPDLIYKRL